jgi:hypothetical protein
MRVGQESVRREPIHVYDMTIERSDLSIHSQLTATVTVAHRTPKGLGLYLRTKPFKNANGLSQS